MICVVTPPKPWHLAGCGIETCMARYLVLSCLPWRVAFFSVSAQLSSPFIILDRDAEHSERMFAS